jgi:hypothetical protein
LEEAVEENITMGEGAMAMAAVMITANSTEPEVEQGDPPAANA